MAGFNGRDKYEDYTYDDEIMDEFYDEDDESEVSFTESISNFFKSIPQAFRKADDEDDEYEDEDYDVKEYKPKKSFSERDKYLDYDYDDAPSKPSKKNSAGYTREDYDSYDKKYGTSGSYVRAEQSEKNKARIFMQKKDKKRTADGGNVTSLYEDIKYKGNVKGVLKFSPKSIDDTNDIADSLINQYAVLIDLKGMSKAEILRILDFIDGVAYVLKYSFDEISKEIYMCAPKGFLKDFNRSKYSND